MMDTPGPQTLRALAERLHEPAARPEVESLLEHAEVWEAERARKAELAGQLESERQANARLTEELTLVTKRLQLLEQDRKWWQTNAIKRVKRAEARGSTRRPAKKR